MTPSASSDRASPREEVTPKPLIEGKPTALMQVLVWVFVIVPFVALAAMFPLAIWWGWEPSVLDIVLIVVMYTVTCSGIGVGFHRYFTHGSFKAKRWFRIVLAIFGSMAVQGPVIQWVADHRRHHAFSDEEGDPHSPWAHGGGFWGILRGLWHAHWGWLFHRELSNRDKFAPDLLADKRIRKVDALFPLFVVLSLGGPAVIGGLATWSWHGAASAFFWAGIVRVGILHHITWSINSICHMVGEKPFEARGEARNFWWLAIPSFGEAWHNLHHAEPTCARHGVDSHQVDINACIIKIAERFGWAFEVKWPRDFPRLEAKRRKATV